MDLWSQIYLLDMGAPRKTITGYRQKYFRPGRTNGQVVFDYRALDGSERAIYDKISDICISMKAKDYLELPERMDRDVKVRLSETNMKKYIEFEKEQILRLPEEETGDVSALNAAALSNKLLQFANGAVYDSERGVHEIHAEKLEALAEIVEAANGQPGSLCSMRSSMTCTAYRKDSGHIARSRLAAASVSERGIGGRYGCCWPIRRVRGMGLTCRPGET